MRLFVFLILSLLIVSSCQCVRNETRSKGRIIGQDAVGGQFPYAVFIEVFYEYYYLECTGTLIGPEWILSTAKCIDGMDHAIVYLGSIMRHSGAVAYTVYPPELKLNPYWDIQSGFHDIVLISIPRTDICYSIFPVPLPKMSSSRDNYEGHSAIASGWNEVSPKMQWMRVTVMTNQECAAAYGYTNVIGIICSSAASFQCSANNFGGPLLSEDYGVLIGILSKTIEHNGACVLVYTRIASYLTWIKTITDISY